jgi:glycosyltransferase involved in cell wall biosynthesis
MKRVLHVMNRLERSGMETMLLSSFAEWLRLGYKCDVVATSATAGPLAAEMREQGYGVYHMPFRSKWRYLPRLRFIRDFYQLSRSDYDVVHVHTEAGRPAFAILAKLAGVRHIAITPHNTFTFRGALRLRKLCERHLIRLLGGRFGMISEGVRACEWDQFRIKGDRILNWFDTSHFRPPSAKERGQAREALGIGENQFVIVSVGNCNSAKNHDSLLQALSILPAVVKPLYLHIGREVETFRERQLAVILNIEKKVRFLQSQSDPLPFLWAADLFAMPSHYEGLGIAALEAIAASTPTLISNVPGLADIAAITQSTFLTTTTPESIAKGILEAALMDPSKRRDNALVDSVVIRNRFSLQNGVRSVVQTLYSHPEQILCVD